MPDTPLLSVIIASYRSRCTIGGCLESLRNQRTDNAYEVIVADSSDDGTADIVAERFPEVRLLRFHERKFPGDARNAAIEAARAGIVASIDADCMAGDDWIEEILKAHADPSVAIGGAIGNAESRNVVCWAAYLCEFTEWMPGAPKKWMANIATANMSYKKRVFQEYGRYIEGTYGSDTDFHWRLGRHGHRLLWVPSIAVQHRSIGEFGKFLRHEFHHGMDCGRMRIRSQKFSRVRRWFYAICFPLIAVKLFAAVTARNLRNRTYLGEFLRASPLVVLGLVSWSIGELAAYVRPRYGTDRAQG